MQLDLNRMTAAAVAAAVEDGKEPPRRRRPGLRALAAGAALLAAARVAVSVSRAPDLSSLIEENGRPPHAEDGDGDPGDPAGEQATDDAEPGEDEAGEGSE